MKKTHVMVMQSIGELFDYANEKVKMKNDNNSEIYSKTERGGDEEEFYGRQSEVYEKYAKHNVKDEAQRIGGAISELSSIDFDSVKWEFKQRLEDGDSVDVNRYLDGHERCWCGVKREIGTKKVIRIFTNFGGNCSRSKDEIAINGAIAVTLCEILESLGIGVELWAANLSECVGGDRSNLLQCIKVKKSNEFSDLGMINYITGDDHVFRNTIFRSWCRFYDEIGIDTVCGLGHHGEIDISMFDDAESGNYDGTIIIPSIYTIDEARKWIVNTLKERVAKMK